MSAHLHLATDDGQAGGWARPSGRSRSSWPIDHAAVRRNLRLLLDGEDDFEVIAEAADLSTVMRHVHGHLPHVLVLDLRMPNGSSIETIRRLRTQVPDTEIVVLTMENSAVFAQQAIDAGAIGFVLKDRADGELPDGGPPCRAWRGVRQSAGRGRDSRRYDDGPRRRPEPTGDRGPAPDRARPHERRDRDEASPLQAHCGDASGADPSQARAPHARELVGYALRRPSDRRLSSSRLGRRALRQLGADEACPVSPELELERAAGQVHALAHAGEAEARRSARRCRSRRRRPATSTITSARRVRL